MSRTVAGIDIGSFSLKAVAFRLQRGVPELVSAGLEPLEDVRRLDEGAERHALLQGKLNRLAQTRDLPLSNAVLAISGHKTMLRYVQVPPAPPWRLEALMRFHASEQSLPGGDESSRASVHDFRLLDVPDVDGQFTVLLALAQETLVNERVAFVAAVDVDDPDVDLAAIALYNAYLHGHGYEDDDPTKCVMLLDIGAEETQIVISKAGGLIFARHHTGGGERLSQAVKEALDCTDSKAETVKVKRGGLPEDPTSLEPEDAKIIEAISHEISDLARAIEATVLYARAQTKLKSIDIGRIYLSGGTAKLPGLADYFARRFRAEASLLQPFRKVSLGCADDRLIARIEEQSSELAIAVGLSLSRLAERGATLDLRTPEAKEKRRFATRGIFAYAAAAVFVLGFVLWFAGSIRDRMMLGVMREAAATQVSQDEQNSAALRQAREQHELLTAKIDAMRERVTSGEDLLRTLSQIKKRTPAEIRLVSFSTSRPAALEEGGSATSTPATTGGRRGERTRDDRVEKKPQPETFQERRVVFIHGYARSKTSLPDAFRELNRYQNSLRELDELFSDVRQRKLRQVEPPSEEADTFIAEFVLELQVAKGKR